MNIALTGDVFLGGDLEGRSRVNITVPSFQKADLRIINLEQAIGDDLMPADKGTLYSDRSVLGVLESMDVGIAGIANNHIHDLGAPGIDSTAESVRSVGVRTAGAGQTLSEARSPVEIRPDLYLLAYCDFARPYLQQVLVAGEGSPGIAPLRFEVIKSDLDRLPPGAKAILFLHWGKEHVWLPPNHDRLLAHQLLNEERVAHIVGMHAHRVQGVIEVGSKRAYMCVGNFLFPNFVYGPPVQILPHYQGTPSHATSAYHRVLKPTKKTWSRVNRASLVIDVDTVTLRATHHWALQDREEPVVRPMPRLLRHLHEGRLRILSSIMRLDDDRYDAVRNLSDRIWGRLWRGRVVAGVVRQMSLRNVLATAVRRLRAHADSAFH